MVAVDIVSRVSSSVNNDNANKIVGGFNTTIQKFPYQAVLYVFRGTVDYQCGGSIISTRYILTAAHCLPGATKIRVRIGSSDADFGGKTYYSSNFKGHPEYNPITSDYDVAYVRSDYKMKLDGVNARTVKLAPSGSFIEPGTILTVSGWGADVENGSVVENLKAVTVPVVSYAACRRAYKTVTVRMICAGEEGKDSCQGDSGGPAVTDDGIQRGVVSFGYGCARPRNPGVYTNVSYVREWISEHTGV
ncbi:trypsin 5G1-like [Maniola jurtina]|uniref:trypsin 5G1-like n=1 Tax=Maniola jurtina TaxID=191418 RepID=UPI001E68E34F|nr:trypsin 5G1-like [Maniola jurtina]